MNYDFDKVFTFKRLYLSYKKCRRGVGWKPSVQAFNSNICLNVYRLYKVIKSGEFKSRGFHVFEVWERGKRRTIKSVTVRERVLQRCLCDYCLVPALSKSLIYDNGASVKGKGYTFHLDRMEHHLRQHYARYGSAGYIVRVDFRHYFDSIPHNLIDRIYRRYIDDQRLTDLSMQLIRDFGDVGLGLGSQVSQITAVAAPNELDHYAKEVLHLKFYARYMDDIYAILPTLDEAETALKGIIEKAESMGFTINEKKTKIRPINNTEFIKVKWILTDDGKVIRKPAHSSYVRMRRKLKKYKQKADSGIMTAEDVRTSWQSWKGYMKKKASYNYVRELENMIREIYQEESQCILESKKKAS